jgi:hypothetical protein
MKVALWFSAVFGALGLITSPVLVVLVLNGTIEATGAYPGGTLQNLGLFGKIVALVLHAYAGVSLGLAQWLAPFLGLFLLLFGIVGVVRRRCSWYMPLLGPLVWVVAYVLQALATAATDWAGSQWMNWDGAVMFGMLVGTSLTAFGLIPLSGTLAWRWCNGYSKTDLDQRYFANLKAVNEVLKGLVEWLQIALGFLAIPVVIDAWAWSWAHWGPGATVAVALVILFVGLGFIRLFLGVAWLLVGALSVVSVGLPVASITTVLGTSQSVTAPADVPGPETAERLAEQLADRLRRQAEVS